MRLTSAYMDASFGHRGDWLCITPCPIPTHCHTILARESSRGCPGQHTPSGSSLSQAGFSRCPDWGQCVSWAPIMSHLGQPGQCQVWRW